MTCELGDLGKGESRVVSLQVVFRRTGRLAIPLVALSTTHDPGPKPNRASFVEDVTQLPDSDVGRPSEDELSGTSSGGARAIRLGVVLTGGGAKVPGKGAYGGGSAASCRWVTSVAVRFKRQAGRQCNRPVWLKAKGTRRWRLAFRRPLPPGRYTVISSASARSGMAETSFSKRDGNRRTFTVRR